MTPENTLNSQQRNISCFRVILHEWTRAVFVILFNNKKVNILQWSRHRNWG
jgi:hypothetical protein